MGKTLQRGTRSKGDVENEKGARAEKFGEWKSM